MRCDRFNTPSAAFSICTNNYVTFHSGTNAASDRKLKDGVQNLPEDDAINLLKAVIKTIAAESNIIYSREISFTT